MRVMRKTHAASPVARRILIIAALCAVVIAVGIIGYRLIGGPASSWLDCLYMTIITVLTIGYEEVIDLSAHPGGRVFTMFVAFGGIGIIGYALSSVTAFAVSGELRSEWRRWKMDRVIEELSGHYIICGWSRVAGQIAQELLATQRAVVMFGPKIMDALREHDRLAAVPYVDAELGDDESLKLAGIERAAGVFAAADDDPLNIVTCMTARQLNPQLRIVAATSDPRHADKMKKAGANAVVNAFMIGGLRMASEMVRPAAVSFLDTMLREQQQRLRIEEIPLNARFENRPVGDLNLNACPDSLLVAVRKGSEWKFNPAPDWKLEAGNILIFMTTPGGRERLEKALG